MPLRQPRLFAELGAVITNGACWNATATKPGIERLIGITLRYSADGPHSAPLGVRSMGAADRSSTLSE
jgi:hypothetical protein